MVHWWLVRVVEWWHDGWYFHPSSYTTLVTLFSPYTQFSAHLVEILERRVKLTALHEAEPTVVGGFDRVGLLLQCDLEVLNRLWDHIVPGGGAVAVVVALMVMVTVVLWLVAFMWSWLVLLLVVRSRSTTYVRLTRSFHRCVSSS